MATDGCPNAPGCLFVTDCCTKIQFLVDTGSELCDFPRSAVQQRRARSTYHLSAANGITINTYGYINLELNLSLRTLRSPKHTNVHFIKTSPGPPVSCPPRRLAPDKLQIGKCEFEAMLNNGTTRPSKSYWSSPLHFAPKKESG
ncbi:hypothetical protein EVAR_68842_1 [Eumeta japonica]|uniref:Peptidase A2 domain-containing protein n=1 Tax=Eumeta variegata TaxID=151549 RepID=A0A4C2A8X1_EUMVA|nr:hypothetical protein EVAR_68842_1 [Eumeta japonica]